MLSQTRSLDLLNIASPLVPYWMSNSKLTVLCNTTPLFSVDIVRWARHYLHSVERLRAEGGSARSHACVTSFKHCQTQTHMLHFSPKTKWHSWCFISCKSFQLFYVQTGRPIMKAWIYQLSVHSNWRELSLCFICRQETNRPKSRGAGDPMFSQTSPLLFLKPS